MRIVFNGLRTGFGNNGGSQTIMLLALALAKREHVVEIWSDTHNQHSWNPLPEDDGEEHPNKIVNPKFRRIVEPRDSRFDIAFAVGSNSIDTTRKIKARARVNWIRNIELWRKPEAVLIEEFADKAFTVWSNSAWISEWVKARTGRKCDVVYPCVGVEKYKPAAGRDNGFTVGFINAHQHSHPDKRVEVCVDAVSGLKKDGKIKVAGFGSMKGGGIYDKYVQNPPFEEKLAILQSCDLWMTANMRKGLSLSTLEASLCGVPCLVPRTRECGAHDWFPKELSDSLMFDAAEEAAALIAKFMARPAEDRARLGGMFRKRADIKFKPDDKAVAAVEKKLEDLI